jgi:hypothetical protein
MHTMASISSLSKPESLSESERALFFDFDFDFFE